MRSTPVLLILFFAIGTTSAKVEKDHIFKDEHRERETVFTNIWAVTLTPGISAYKLASAYGFSNLGRVFENEEVYEFAHSGVPKTAAKEHVFDAENDISKDPAVVSAVQQQLDVTESRGMTTTPRRTKRSINFNDPL